MKVLKALRGVLAILLAALLVGGLVGVCVIGYRLVTSLVR